MNKLKKDNNVIEYSFLATMLVNKRKLQQEWITGRIMLRQEELIKSNDLKIFLPVNESIDVNKLNDTWTKLKIIKTELNNFEALLETLSTNPQNKTFIKFIKLYYGKGLNALDTAVKLNVSLTQVYRYRTAIEKNNPELFQERN